MWEIDDHLCFDTPSDTLKGSLALMDVTDAEWEAVLAAHPQAKEVVEEWEDRYGDRLS